jgi:hypothetical protein
VVQCRSTDIWREKKFCHKNFYLKETVENIPGNSLFNVLVKRLGVTVPYMEPLYVSASCKCRDFSEKSALKELDS